MISSSELLSGLKTDFRLLSRALTYVENDLPEGYELLKLLPANVNSRVIGITGAPGAGKSTLINALLAKISASGKRTAVLAIDPTSPFNYGSLLGDRVRMSTQFTNDSVYIRSIATRGALGGLSARTIEMVDVLRASMFDYIFVETVGVGQSEVDIASLADTTILVLVPGYGDDVQNMKSGIMEIADIFVINKSDRPGAEACANNIEKLLHLRGISLPVIKTSAGKGEGIAELADCLDSPPGENKKALMLLTERAYKLIESRRMNDVSKEKLSIRLSRELNNPNFNLYQFAENPDF